MSTAIFSSKEVIFPGLWHANTAVPLSSHTYSIAKDHLVTPNGAAPLAPAPFYSLPGPPIPPAQHRSPDCPPGLLTPRGAPDTGVGRLTRVIWSAQHSTALSASLPPSLPLNLPLYSSFWTYWPRTRIQSEASVEENMRPFHTALVAMAE